MNWQLVGNIAGPKGQDGRNADDAVVLALKGEIVELKAQLDTRPQPSVDADLISAMVKAAVAEAFASLPTPKDGAPGADGVSVDPQAVAALVKSAVADAVAAVPPPKDGERGERGDAGEPGASVDPAAVDVMVRAAVADAHSRAADQVRPLVAEEVRKAVTALPVPKDGERGEAGAAGASVDPADVEAMVVKAVAAIPRPTNGQDGRSVTVDDVAPLITSEVQKAVYALPEPQDGVGVVGALIDRSGHLIVTLSDGTVKDVGPVVGQDGTPGIAGRDGSDGIRGIDGKDGLGFDDMIVEQDGDRGIVVKLIEGDRVKTFGPFVFPVLVYKGVWVAGHTYEHGQTVTWGGSMWHANKETTAKPGDGSSDWTLSVKKGSDGKEGKAITGPPGPRGEPGPIGPGRY